MDDDLFRRLAGDQVTAALRDTPVVMVVGGSGFDMEKISNCRLPNECWRSSSFTDSTTE